MLGPLSGQVDEFSPSGSLRRIAGSRRCSETTACFPVRPMGSAARGPYRRPPDSTVRPIYASAESAKRPAPDVLDFGRYAGWSLGDLARHDPNYLRWLSRHSSGIRYRRRIDQLFAVPRSKPASERIRGR